MKKLLLLMMVLLPAVATLAEVDDEFIVDGLKYKVTSEDPQIVELMGYDGERPIGDLVIPATVNSYSVTSICENAFRGCSALTSITLPNGVISIGNRAIFGCTSLTSITLPASVASIGDWTFGECTGLTSINVADGNESFASMDGVLLDKDKKTIIAYPAGKTDKNYTIPDGVTCIGKGAFYNCIGLTSVISSNSLTSIGEWAFESCTGLISVEIPNSVTSIDKGAFYGCIGLTSVTIPGRVASIGESAFRYCSGLTSVEISNSVTSIGGNAFSGCTNLVSVNIPAGMISIGGNAFSGTGWYSNQKDGLLYLDNWLLGYKGAKPTDELKVAEGTLGIADGAFSGCSDLTSITIPNSMTSIGNSAFSGCYFLQFVNFAEGCQLTNIGNEAFSNCIYLFFIAIPANVTNIGSSAFENCSCLFFVSIGSSVKSIGGSAFKDCSSLRSVSFAENSQLTTIGSYAFQNCTSLSSITIPENVTSIGYSAFRGCSGIADIYCYAAPAILEWIYATSSLAKRDFKPNKETLCHVKTDKLDAFNEKFENVNVTFVENMYDFVVDNLRYRITNIASTDQTDNTKDANESHNTVELFGYVALPSGVVEIPAFVNHNGEEYAVTSISEGVFSGCTSLTSIMVDTENMNYSSIDGVLFDKTGITLITYPAGKPDASYTIPARVTSIGNQAFYLCEGLTSVTIPEWEINYGIGVYDWSYNVADVYCYHALPVTADEISNFSGIMTGYMIYRRTKFHVAGDVAAWKKAFPNANVTFVGDLYPMLTIDGLNYRITSEDSKTVELIGYDGTKPFGDLSIPATVNGYSVTSIGDNAFRGCVDLTSITIPVSVTSIGNDVFYGCADLKSIVVTTGNPVYDSRDNCNAIIRTQDNTLIAGCKNTVIPGSVTSIGDAAFRGCYRLTSITIPASVTSIGNYVFYNCTSLESVIFADGSQLASIGYYAFSYCQNLMSISIPDGVTNINDHTFYSCTSLTLVNIPANVTIIDYGAFEKCTSLTSINFTENSQLTSIGSYAFRNCTSLTSLNIPDGVTNISWEAFMSCTGLTSVVIPSSVISIGWLAFYGCI